MYKYYGFARPITIGAVPNQKENPIVEVKNFDRKEMTADSGREVYGYVVYGQKLNDDDVKHYDLILAGEKYWTQVIVKQMNNGDVVVRIGKKIKALEKPEERRCIGKRSEIAECWFGSDDEARLYAESIIA